MSARYHFKKKKKRPLKFGIFSLGAFIKENPEYTSRVIRIYVNERYRFGGRDALRSAAAGRFSRLAPTIHRKFRSRNFSQTDGTFIINITNVATLTEMVRMVLRARYDLARAQYERIFNDTEQTDAGEKG